VDGGVIDAVPRLNFSSLWSSVVAIYDITDNENSDGVLEVHMAVAGPFAALFFLVVLLLVNWTFLNVLIAILLASFEAEELAGSGIPSHGTLLTPRRAAATAEQCLAEPAPGAALPVWPRALEHVSAFPASSGHSARWRARMVRALDGDAAGHSSADALLQSQGQASQAQGMLQLQQQQAPLRSLHDLSRSPWRCCLTHTGGCYRQSPFHPQQCTRSRLRAAAEPPSPPGRLWGGKTRCLWETDSLWWTDSPRRGGGCP
jgi:hypothetical protein